MRVLSVPLGNIPKQIFYPLGQWAFGLLYRRAVREFGRPDVLHAHFTDYGYLACPLARREQLPLVLTEHGLYRADAQRSGAHRPRSSPDGT